MKGFIMRKFIIGLFILYSTSIYAQLYYGPFKADGSNLPPGAVTQNYSRNVTLNRGLVGTTINVTGQITGQRVSLTNGLNAVTGNFSGDFTVDTNTLFVDSTNNRIGLGTTVPQEKLQLDWSNTRFVFNNQGSGIVALTASVNGYAGGAPYAEMRWLADGSSGGALSFWTKQSGLSLLEKVRISEFGYLGIGLVTPNTTLHVSGNATMRGAVFGYTTTATAAGTTTLTNSSTFYQDFTGSTTQTCTLPAVSTLATGWTFDIRNHSSGTVTVQSSGANTIFALTANTYVRVICISTSGTGTASWSWVTGNIGG